MFLIRLLAADRTNTVHVSIVSCLVSVFHCTCSKLQIQFCASAVRLRRVCQPGTVILSHVGNVFYFIPSCEIVEKACSFKDANCRLLLELNHQLQKVPLVKWIKVIVEAISRLVNHPNPTLKPKKKFNVQTVLEVYWKSLLLSFLSTQRCYSVCTHGCFLSFHLSENTTEIKLLPLKCSVVLRERLEVLFFSILVFCVFTVTEKYIQVVATAQFQCPWVILNILNTENWNQMYQGKTDMQKRTLFCH